MKQKDLKGMIGDVLDILMPRRCVVCGTKLLRRERQLCTVCAMNMPLTYFWTMERNPMSDKLNAHIEAHRAKCGITSPEPYSHAAALYCYLDNYREISKALKYNANIRAGIYVSEALGRKLAGSAFLNDADMVIPVPLHWTRRLKRGYNQAEVIASTLGKPVENKLLKRSRHTKSQAMISLSEKSANVAGAFTVNMQRLREIMLYDAAPRHILLVDDVFTTGATLSECHFALRDALKQLLGTKKAAAVKISVATLAYVGD